MSTRDLSIQIDPTQLTVQSRILRTLFDQLQHSMRSYGSIGDRQGGLLGLTKFLLKKFVRKLILRHIDQGREVHDKLLKHQKLLIAHLSLQDQILEDTLGRLQALEYKLNLNSSNTDKK